MLRIFITAFALWLGLQAHATEPADPTPPPEYAIEAIAMRVHGPYWQLRVDKSGTVTYAHWDKQNYLTIKGSLLLPRAQIDTLLNSPAIAQLAPLPQGKGPRPVAMHMPEFAIRLQTGTDKRQVRVYDPETLPPSAELDQFWAAWKAIWALMPQWQLAANGPQDLFPNSQPTPP